MARALIGAALVALSLGWGGASPRVSAAAAERFVRPGSAAAGLSACVEPTAYMRRNHMELIQHQRDATVHQGIRGARYSLAGCIDCHVSRGADGEPVAVNGKRQFCNACHAFAAVTVNCFDCHAAVPGEGPLSPAALRALGAAHGDQAQGDPGGVARAPLGSVGGDGVVAPDPRGSGER